MYLNPDDTVYPVAKIAVVLDALACRSRTERRSVKACAPSRSFDFFACDARPRSIRSSIAVLTPQSARMILILPTTPGLRFHVSAYGMYGFAFEQQSTIATR